MLNIKDMKIWKKLTIIFGMMVFCIVLCNGVVNYLLIDDVIQYMITSELDNVSQNLLELCRSSVDSSIKNYLRSISEKARKLTALYYNEYRRGKMTQAQAYAQLKRLLKDKAFYRIGKTGYLAGVSSKGVLKIHPKSEGVDASRHKFMQRAIKMKNGFLTYKWKNKGEKVWREKVGWLSYFEPWDIILWASSYKDEFLYLTDMQTLRKAILAVKIGKAGYAYVLDSKGNTIFHPVAGNSGKNIYNSRDDDGNYFIREICQIKNGIKEYPWSNKKGEAPKMKIARFRYFKDMDWIIAVSAYKDELYRAKYIQRNLSIVLILISLLIVVPVIMLMSNRITMPVQQLNESFTDLAKGDLTQSMPVQSGDEIGELSEKFNHFIASLHQQVISIKKAAYDIDTAVQDLNVSSKEIAATSNQQAASVKEVVTTMEDSDALAKGVSKKINEVAKIADNTRSTVEHGSAMIKQNLEMMGEIKQKNSDTITGIRALNDKIKSIWEVVNIINAIADQTKIIAFNAELEASAAGEAGRNFEIVADEIRRLADNTVSSTKEIKDKIDDIQQYSDRLIISSEQETEKIRQGWEISTTAGELFEDILQSSEVSAKSAGEIARSIDQQTMAFSQILITMKQISEGIDNFVVSTKSTSQASEAMKEISEKLTQLVEEYTVKDSE